MYTMHQLSTSCVEAEWTVAGVRTVDGKDGKAMANPRAAGGDLSHSPHRGNQDLGLSNPSIEQAPARWDPKRPSAHLA